MKKFKKKKIFLIIDLVFNLLGDTIGFLIGSYLYLDIGLEFVEYDVKVVGDIINNDNLGYYCLVAFLLATWLLSVSIVGPFFSIKRFIDDYKRLKRDYYVSD